MKVKSVISIIIACLTLVGCSQNKNTEKKRIKIDYSDMFKNSANSQASAEKYDFKANSPNAKKDMSTDDTEAVDDKNYASPSVKETQNAYRASANNTSDTQSENDNTSAPQPEENSNVFENAGTETNSNTTNKTIGNRKSSTVFYTNDQAVADLQLGDICYFPYKTDSELKPPNANVVSPKETKVTEKEEGEGNEKTISLIFTASVSQSTADEINKLSDSNVKEIQDVIDGITAEAPADSGLDNNTKFCLEPNTALPEKSDGKTTFWNMAFQNSDNVKIQPQKAVKVSFPVPSGLKNSSDVGVYLINKNNSPERLNADIQTIDGAEYIVFETSALGSYAISDGNLNKTKVDKYKKDAEKALQKKEKVYDYGYRVVFRTETDTYLLGIFPYDECEWNNVNDICLEISSRFKSDVQMVGVPSLEDLQYFTKCGIYLSGQYEMWTSTPTSATGTKAYYRNEKGAFYSTKDKSKKCGVCAIIRINSPQNNEDLISSFLPDYEETKSRLEEEENQYKLSLSE